MTQGVYGWSKTAATNASADSSINWAEGQSPSSVNDSARAMMARLAEYRDDNAGTLTTGGTSTAYTLSSNQSFDTLAHLSGQSLRVKFNATNGASPTLNVDSLGAKAINVDTSTAVGTGVIKANSIWLVTYDNSNSCFILSGVPAAVQDGTVATASIADNAVSLAKMATLADQTLIGNVSGATATPEAITIGTGFNSSGSTLNAATPPQASFKNLAIKVTDNTHVSVTADFVTMTDGTSYLTKAVSTTVNMGTTGAGALDTGTIASGTWYAIWAIAKADGTVSAIASTSISAPTMPSGYTMKARVGRVVTASGSAQLMGTWQLGRDTQYVVGLAQCSALPIIKSGSSGSVSAPTWTAVSTVGAVPDTASHIKLVVFGLSSNGVATMVAPNNSYGAFNSTTNPPPIAFDGQSNTTSATFRWMGEFLLESTSIYYASQSSSAGVAVIGWRDNI